MKVNLFLYSWAVVGALAFPGLADADHDKACKHVHGKVTVVTQEGISVDDKLYKVGETTRITKDDKTVKLTELSAGDVVCVDVRGKDDIGSGEVAAVAVISPSDRLPIREKQYVREKETVRRVSHDKNCNHVHGKVTRVRNSTLYVDDKPYTCRETTRIVRDDQTVALEKIKTGDFVCMTAIEDDNADRRVSEVIVLNPTDSVPFQEREIIREREKIREEK